MRKWGEIRRAEIFSLPIDCIETHIVAALYSTHFDSRTRVSASSDYCDFFGVLASKFHAESKNTKLFAGERHEFFSQKPKGGTLTVENFQ